MFLADPLMRTPRIEELDLVREEHERVREEQEKRPRLAAKRDPRSR